MASILIVEDEPSISRHLADLLATDGHDSEVASNGRMASTLFENGHYDLVLLDLNLPFVSGKELCKQFREQNANVPILVITAFSDIQTKLATFELGADDFISKPFYPEEVLAKVRIFLRRMLVPSGATEHIVVGDLEVNVAAKQVTRAGVQIRLTPKEFALLELLAESVGRVVSKTEILRKVWNIGFDTGSNTVEVYMSFLRNKIDKPFQNKLLHTKPGFGYVLSPDQQ